MSSSITCCFAHMIEQWQHSYDFAELKATRRHHSLTDQSLYLKLCGVHYLEISHKQAIGQKLTNKQSTVNTLVCNRKWDGKLYVQCDIKHCTDGRCMVKVGCIMQSFQLSRILFETHIQL